MLKHRFLRPIAHVIFQEKSPEPTQEWFGTGCSRLGGKEKLVCLAKDMESPLKGFQPPEQKMPIAPRSCGPLNKQLLPTLNWCSPATSPQDRSDLWFPVPLQVTHYLCREFSSPCKNPVLLNTDFSAGWVASPCSRSEAKTRVTQFITLFLRWIPYLLAIGNIHFFGEFKV